MHTARIKRAMKDGLMSRISLVKTASQDRCREKPQLATGWKKDSRSQLAVTRNSRKAWERNAGLKRALHAFNFALKRGVSTLSRVTAGGISQEQINGAGIRRRAAINAVNMQPETRCVSRSAHQNNRSNNGSNLK